MAGLHWQSYVLTQVHINRAISGGTDENRCSARLPPDQSDLPTDEERGVTAEHLGEDAREKAEN